MTQRVAWMVLFLCGLVLPAFSQGHSGGKPGGTSSGGTSLPGSLGSGSGPSSITHSAVFFSGKVVLDDGTELTEPASIQTICSGQRHTEAYTDSHGNFSFQFGDTSSSANAAFTDASSNAMSGPSPNQNQRDWRGCQVQAVLGGFSSETVELSSRVSNLENADLGRLALHRLEHVEGTSISVTSALAPPAARKALEKGREQEKKQKWDDAQKSFAKAVEIYPKYAVAWYELGRLQLHVHNLADGQKSFQKASAADPKYVNPYEALAQLAFQARQWQEVDRVTTQLLALNPVNFLDAYFMNGVANLYLHSFDAAEKICRQGIAVDGTQHQIPKLHYLLAMVLVEKREYAESSEQLRTDMALTKDPNERAAAQRELEHVAKLSANANPTPADGQK
jgi:tetratricopeptide (TPR) repeat protein